MEGKQSPTKVSSCYGEGDLVGICVLLSQEGGHRVVIHWGSNSQAHQAHATGHHIDVSGPWHGILKKLSREHCGLCYPYGALFPGWFQWGACNFMGWVIPMQGPHDFCKPWWRCLLSTAQLLPLWPCLLNWGWWGTHCLGGSCGFWSSYTMSHCEHTPANPLAPAVASLPLASLIRLFQFCQPRGGDHSPVGWQVVP